MSNMNRRIAVDRDDAHISDDTESAYVKMFTTDMVTLNVCACVCVYVCMHMWGVKNI